MDVSRTTEHIAPPENEKPPTRFLDSIAETVSAELPYETMMVFQRYLPSYLPFNSFTTTPSRKP